MQQFGGLTVAVPRETMPGEKRVAAIPQTVQNLMEAGARVLVQAEAGEGSFLADELYRTAGAAIISCTEELFQSADILLKVKEPRVNEQLGRHEAELLRDGTVLVCFLHPAHSMNHETIRILARKNVTSFTLDGIPRISRAQQMDSLTSMSTAAGYKAVIIAAYHLPHFIPMMPTPFGVIQPAQFLVVGTGVAGLQAIATARRLGAKVKALDIRPEAMEQARSLGAEMVPFELPPELAVAPGGYARRLPDEWYLREKEALAPHLEESDAVILTALIPGEQAPVLIDETMVRSMKKGSVIVDIAVDQGGNCALTRCAEEYSFDGITISGLANIPATLAVDSTWMFAQNAWYFLKHIVNDGTINPDMDDEITAETLVTKDGRIVHRGALLAMESSSG